MIGSFEGLVGRIKGIMILLIPILIALALLYFLWGVAEFILNAGSEEKRAEGRNKIIYGLIGLFVMIAVWGFVNVLLGTFRLDLATPTFPRF